MSNRISAIQRQFNRRANSYDAHAHVQRMMADQLTQSLLGWKSKGITDAPNILEIGCGTGALTRTLATEWPSASITALDIAPAMIRLAEQHVQSAKANHSDAMNHTSDHIHFLLADVEVWAADAPVASFDLIVSNACFQWLSNPTRTLSHLRRMLRSEGMLIFTTFGPDTFYELHQAFNSVYQVSGMEPQRHGLSFQSADQWKSLLEEAGFASSHYERTIHTEKYASARDFLLSVKAMGASTSEAAAKRGLSSRRLFANMYKEYENMFSIQDGVAATYDLLLIHSCASY
ncbi:malonyl-[acyl-carrier protein] O-methyltransferase [Paenibacillus baekrokdamisoli]|uniref:Malonyl-[acyl-carrier protein] O-methyltransferase n=1 Tax=Paenibacillus baekrokdamisoli TaxID=1712516 RepID=A0A3G9ISP5_9BACL|nr:malonyl-ACP O-methyltransferase BioC [Paenibacillus baekrokdamisoli]MBB3067773.1 malonyl-CoA O-methyltransferase [Paenibacillus baekrokdamisoli]BBH19045.1 malonyl-[acyl-carrier protein] O-methyltransferase [Paenibacillus baekrokdamisoli]